MTNAITLTADLAYASGVDAANSQMRAAGRKAWSTEDRDLAVKVRNRLALYIPLSQGGLKGLPRKFLLNHAPAQSADRERRLAIRRAPQREG